MDNLLDYNHAMMNNQEWNKLIFSRGDFAFLHVTMTIQKYIKFYLNITTIIPNDDRF